MAGITNEGYRIFEETVVVPDPNSLAAKLLGWLQTRLVKRTYCSTGHVTDVLGGFTTEEGAKAEAEKMNKTILHGAESHPDTRTTVRFTVIPQSQVSKLRLTDYFQPK